MATAARSASRDKVRAHRARLRKQGLRPVQIYMAELQPALMPEGRKTSTPGTCYSAAVLDA